MQNERLTHSAESSYVKHLRRLAATYLEGGNDWRWITGILHQSGLGKREMLDILTPLKGHGWRFRSQALFGWLEQ